MFKLSSSNNYSTVLCSLPLLRGLRLAVAAPHLFDERDKLGVVGILCCVSMMAVGLNAYLTKRQLKSDSVYLRIGTKWIASLLALVGMGILEIARPAYFVGEGLAYCFLGELLVIIGSYLPQLPFGGPLGFKLPWTLAHAAIWRQTHKFAAYLWQHIGLLLAILGCLQLTHRLLLDGLMLVALISPLLYGRLLPHHKYPGEE